MGLVFNPKVIHENEGHGGMILTGKTEELGEKSVSCANFPTANPVWNDLGANPGLRDERPETNHLSHGTACRMFSSVASWFN
jgi:hypothetical protein